MFWSEARSSIPQLIAGLDNPCFSSNREDSDAYGVVMMFILFWTLNKKLLKLYNLTVLHHFYEHIIYIVFRTYIVVRWPQTRKESWCSSIRKSRRTTTKASMQCQTKIISTNGRQSYTALSIPFGKAERSDYKWISMTNTPTNRLLCSSRPKCSIQISTMTARSVLTVLLPNAALQNKWSPMIDIPALLTSIRSLLDDPNPESPANQSAAQLFLQNRA